MFQCAVTAKVSKVKESAHKVVTQVRKVTYVNEIFKGEPAIVSRGFETVREVLCSDEGLQWLKNPDGSMPPPIVVEEVTKVYRKLRLREIKVEEED